MLFRSVIAALYASLSGWLFAHYQRSVNPSPFGLQMGIEYRFMAVLGGVGLVGGALLVGLLDSFSSFWASAYKDVIVFTAIIPVLLLRSLTDRHHEDE